MKRFALAAVVAATLPLPSEAAVISRDWLAPGDGLLTLDTSTGREWLDLSQTRLGLFPPNGNLFVPSLEERYQNVVAQLPPDGLFAGFTVAKLVDVQALATSAGIDLLSSEYDVNGVATANLIELLGLPIPFSGEPGSLFTTGYLDEPDLPLTPERRALLLISDLPVLPLRGGFAGLFTSHDDNLTPLSTGVALFRLAIPEPSARLVATLGLAGVAACCGHRGRRLLRSRTTIR